ncbi:MAG: glycosyltransferase family 39 protein [Anaerolineae bacterium]
MPFLRRLANIKTILIAFVLLATAYSVVTPIFETPDEMWHFAYIKSLVDGRGFPAAPIVVADDLPAHESSQPPLYYVAAALVVRAATPDTSDLPSLLQRNPVFPNTAADGTENDNKNIVVHTDREAFPFRGSVLAVHLARLVAVLFGGVTVAATYGLSRETFPSRPATALIAAAVVAFTPQFVFISAAVNNDSAAAAACALALWATIRAMRRGLSLPRALGLGGALALAALSKASALGLVPLATAVTLIASFRQPRPTDPLSRQAELAITHKSVRPQSHCGRQATVQPWPAGASQGGLSPEQRGSSPEAERWRNPLGLITLALGIVAVVAGPWYVRSVIVFGDVLGLTTHLVMPWAYPQPLPFEVALSSLVPAAVTSFWLAFGWATVVAPDEVYTVLNVLALVGLLGAALAFARSRDRVERGCLLLLAAWLALTIVALVRWNQWLGGPLGRLVFPALSAIGALLAIGWTSLVPRRSRSPLVLRLSPVLIALPPLGLLALSVIALPAILAPAYARPAPLSEAQIAQQPGRPSDVRYGSVARLNRIDVPRGEWPHPGDAVAVRLCWETLSADPRSLLTLVQFVGAEDRVVASRRTIPGLGAYPTGVWQPGIRFCDTIRLVLSRDVPAPAVYKVEVSFVDQQTRTRLPAYAPDGALLAATFVDLIKIAPLAYTSPSIENTLTFRLGDQIDLIGYMIDPASTKPGGATRLRLYWRALRRPDADYTVFVHLRDTTGQLVAQADSPPQAGEYPTSFWDAGEVVADDRSLVIPAGVASGEYVVVVGLYQLLSGQRLIVAGREPATEITLPAPVEVR